VNVELIFRYFRSSLAPLGERARVRGSFFDVRRPHIRCSMLLSIVLTVVVAGCASPRPPAQAPPDLLGEKIISERLRENPVLLPDKTPFDDDMEKRQVYLAGFERARDFIVSGYFLHATIGLSRPKGFEEPWDAGWRDGTKLASDRWMQEAEKLRNQNHQP